VVKLRLYGHLARLDSETGISIAMESASGNRFSHDHQYPSVSCGMRETRRDPGGEYSRGKVPNVVVFSSAVFYQAKYQAMGVHRVAAVSTRKHSRLR